MNTPKKQVVRVGILTFHEIHNPGAYLQALGTVSLLQESGYDPVLIHYTSPPHRFSMQKILGNWRLWGRPRDMVELFGRHRRFRQERKHLPLTRWLDTTADIQAERFDAVLIGADIVWDYQTPYLGRDPVYFGQSLNTPRRIAFAASCGAVSADQDPPEYVMRGILGMSAISVRDENTQRMVERLGRKAELICDPAFHLDDSRWLKIPAPEDPYVLVYGPPKHFKTKDIVAIKDYAKTRRCKIKAVCYRQSWADENEVCIGPFEWLGFIYAAQAVVTSTFHGTIFALKADKPLAIIDDPHAAVKLSAMSKELELNQFLLKSPRSLADILGFPRHTARIQAVISKWRDQARSFLERALTAS
jgi:hypothetical protein